MTWSTIVLSRSRCGTSGIFQSPPQALDCTAEVWYSSQILNFSLQNSTPLIFVNKSSFKAVLSYNSSKLRNIPSVIQMELLAIAKRIWLYGETSIILFPKLTDGSKISLIKAVLHLPTDDFRRRACQRKSEAHYNT